MSRLLSLIAILALAAPTAARAEWYAPGRGDAQLTQKVEAGDLIQRTPLHKIDLPVVALVLRRDTETEGKYWLEATLRTPLDSGDGYLLAFDDLVFTVIYTRGDKWAVGFTSLELARRCFEHLRGLHKLDADHAHDTTKA